MACSKFEYVKLFERPDTLLLNCWILVRIDGHCFHKFTDVHAFTKPNDLRGLNLANECARKTMQTFPDIRLAYGQSDEYSFLLPPSTTLFSRRESKITSTLVSVFTANYVKLWPEYFTSPSIPSTLTSTESSKITGDLKYLPSFDARAVCYPTIRNVQDYFSWRQVDCHINNLYNTCFWALVQGNTSTVSSQADIEYKTRRAPISNQAAQELLEREFSDAAGKNELLFSDFGRNYNREPEICRKGSVLYRRLIASPTQNIDSLKADVAKLELKSVVDNRSSKKKAKMEICVDHIDIINAHFWLDNPSILAD